MWFRRRAREVETAKVVAPLPLDRYARIVVLTGAGLSAGSGLPTFRGAGGLWGDGEGMQPFFADQLPDRLDELWELTWRLRAAADAAEPNAAHVALARLQQAREGVTLVTQNVDGLLGRAGADALEIHGSLSRWRCSDLDCAGVGVLDPDVPPVACPVCGGRPRPDMVLFGERPDLAATHAAKRALREVDLYLAVGTSGLVEPAASFVRGAKYAGARTVLVNLDAHDDLHPDFDEIHLGPAEEILPALLGGGSGR